MSTKPWLTGSPTPKPPPTDRPGSPSGSLLTPKASAATTPTTPAATSTLPHPPPPRMTANDRAPPHGQNVTLWILVAIAGLASFAGILTIGIFTMPMVYGGAILLLVRPDRTRGVAIMLCAVAAPQYLWPGSTEAAQASSAILTRPTASRAAPNSTLGPGSEAQPPASLSPPCFSFTLGGATPPRSQAQRSRAAGAPRERRTKHERHTEADPWFTHIGVGFPVRGTRLLAGPDRLSRNRPDRRDEKRPFRAQASAELQRGATSRGIATTGQDHPEGWAPTKERTRSSVYPSQPQNRCPSRLATRSASPRTRASCSSSASSTRARRASGSKTSVGKTPFARRASAAAKFG